MTPPPRLHLLNAAFERRAAPLLAESALSPTDLLIVDTVALRFGESRPDALLGLAFALRAPRAGHVGVHLPTISHQIDSESFARRRVPTAVAQKNNTGSEVPLLWPKDPQAWEAQTLASTLVGDTSQSCRPFVQQVLSDGRTLLMTRRMWREQERLADAALSMVTSAPRLRLSDDAVSAGINRLFASAEVQGARAVAAAARQGLTVITGGPGTGKTHSIKRLLALLVEAAEENGSPLRVELAAPTGKAAVRMAESIAENLDQLPISDIARRVLANLEPKTLHRLLGMRPDGTSRHGPSQPLSADLVVVDEASMVDLSLMRRLFEAIPEGARLVLLGDRDQLASVEAGTVLSDLVGPVLEGGGGGPLQHCIVPFETNYRFKEAPTIAALASALQGRGAPPLKQISRWVSGTETALGETLSAPIVHLGAPPLGRPDESQLDRLAAPYLDAAGVVGMLCGAIAEHGANGASLRQTSLHRRLLKALDAYRILAVHRHGATGVEGLEHAMVERAQHRLEDAIRARSGLAPESTVKLPSQGAHWLGRPILITENSYDLGLMNGDIGLILQTARGLAAVFPKGDNSSADNSSADNSSADYSTADTGATREIALTRLPNHRGAFAMTVHKSQGSQFQRVALVLAGRDSPIQTRELLYTAITRTSSRLDWLGDPREFSRALRRRVRRASGLGELLWGSAAPSPGAPLEASVVEASVVEASVAEASVVEATTLESTAQAPNQRARRDSKTPASPKDWKQLDLFRK